MANRFKVGDRVYIKDTGEEASIVKIGYNQREYGNWNYKLDDGYGYMDSELEPLGVLCNCDDCCGCL